MVMALEDFKSVVKDVARPNRFLVQILPNPAALLPPPGGGLFSKVRTGVAGARVVLGDPRSWFFLTKSIDLPSRQVNVLEHKRMGVTRKFAGDPTVEDLNVTFLNDTGYVARSLIDTWHENIVTQNENMRHRAETYSDGSFILVEHMGPNNLPIAIYKFNDVWPSAIDAAQLDQDATDTASEFSVRFSYNTWTRIF
jgi:hypothetical protein